MKSLFIVFGLLASISVSAKSVECTNQSLYWEEDSLSLDLDTMRGSYFDNDTDRELKCFNSEIEEEQGYIYCHQEGDRSDLITRIKPNGDATVIYSADQWIDFSCEL